MKRLSGLLVLLALCSSAGAHPVDVTPEVLKIAQEVKTSPGNLPRLQVTVKGETKPLPLQRTDVFAELSTHVATVDVVQTYKNGFKRPIDAVYVFPLPENAAVDDLKIEVAGRVIVAEIQRREDARKTYEAARKAGNTAALLEQERPNIFTQSVANIPPGEEIKVMVRFVQQLTHDGGEVEWAFPMVVGPRFIPGNPTGASGTGWSPDTDAVPDASRITPPIVGDGLRSGHDISIEVLLDTGLPIEDLQTPTHEVESWSEENGVTHLSLADHESLPNRDFVLRYRVAAEAPQVAVEAHKKGDDGFVTLVVQPPQADLATTVGRREVLFVVDISGSMSGRPLALAKETARLAIGQLGPADTFNIYTFAGTTARAFGEARPANDENIAAGLRFVEQARAGGGTRLDDAVREALTPAVGLGRHRYVLFLTDGYVGNEDEIFGQARSLVELTEDAGQRARVFAIGTGSNVNRALLGGLAEAGKGQSQVITLREDPDRAVEMVFRAIDAPVLRDVEVDWGGLAVEDVVPARIGDLLATRPLILHARYSQPGAGTIIVKGMTDDGPVELPLEVTLPDASARHSATPTLWARARVAALSRVLWDGPDEETVEAITKLGLAHRLVTAYTSFVAVDRSRMVGRGNAPVVVQPTEAPEGVDLANAAPAHGITRGRIAGGAMGGMMLGTRGYGVGGGASMVGDALVAPSQGMGGIGYGRGALVGNGEGRMGGKAAAPRLAAASPVVMGSLDRAVVQRVFRQHANQVRACYEKELTRKPDLAGRLVLKIVIGADGKVKAASVPMSTLKSTAVETCVVDKAKTWRFPAPKGAGVVEISYPFVFRPR